MKFINILCLSIEGTFHSYYSFIHLYRSNIWHRTYCQVLGYNLLVFSCYKPEINSQGKWQWRIVIEINMQNSFCLVFMMIQMKSTETILSFCVLYSPYNWLYLQTKGSLKSGWILEAALTRGKITLYSTISSLKCIILPC